MKIGVKKQVNVNATTVWSIITNISGSADTISAINKIEILHKPKKGITGLKWRETRIMFGKEATEEMTITEVNEGQWYTTAAESHGSKYLTKVGVTGNGKDCEVYMQFQALPQTIMAKITWALTGWAFKGATKKSLQKDLLDIKLAAEN